LFLNIDLAKGGVSAPFLVAPLSLGLLQLNLAHSSQIKKTILK